MHHLASSGRKEGRKGRRKAARKSEEEREEEKAMEQEKVEKGRTTRRGKKKTKGEEDLQVI